MFGIGPGSQPTDEVHGRALVLEKGLHLHGKGVVAQMDTRTCYDSVPTLCCCLWLQTEEAHRALFTAMARHQVCPSIQVHGEAYVCRSGVDFLTKGRTARALRRVPVLGEFRLSRCFWHRWGFRAESSGASEARKLCVAAYMDNLWAGARRRGAR